MRYKPTKTQFEMQIILLIMINDQYTYGHYKVEKKKEKL